MKQALILLRDWLGIADTTHVDEQDADLAVAVAVLRSDLEDRRARVAEFDVAPARETQA